MSETALDRVARALDLIPFISHNPGLSVVQIADRFNSTPSQISKDLSLLHMCGLPGYTHLELLDIDYEDPNFIAVTEAQVLDHPRSLTQVEAMTLVLGLQLLTELAGDATERLAILALQARITARYGDALSAVINITDAIVESPLATQISKAIVTHRKLIIKYNSASSDSVTSREVYPVHIYYTNGIGYLRAFLPERNAERSFRLDRITELSVGDVNDEIYEALDQDGPEQGISELEIEMGGDGYFFIERHNEIVTSHDEISGHFRIRLKVAPGEWITRTLLAWPSKIVILSPPTLATTITERIAGALRNYQ